MFPRPTCIRCIRALAIALLFTTMMGCGKFLAIAPDEGASTDPTDPTTQHDPNSQANDPNNPKAPSHPTHADPLARRCNVNAPFTQLTDLQNGPGSPPLADLQSLTITSSGIGLASFRARDDLGVLQPITLLGDQLQAASTSASTSFVDTMQSPDNESSATMSADGRVIIIERRSNSSNVLVDLNGSDSQFWVAERAASQSPFGAPIQIHHSLNGRLIEPYLVDTKLYFVFAQSSSPSVPAAGGVVDDVSEASSIIQDIWVGDLDVKTGQLSNAQEVAGLATALSQEGAPTVPADHLEIFYATRDAIGVHTFHASRADRAAPFATGAPITFPAGVTTSADIYPMWISPDGCDLYVLGTFDGSFSLRRLRRSPL